MIYRVNSTRFRPAPIVPPSAQIGTKKHGGLGMTVEKRDQRIVIYLTESEHQALTWAAVSTPPGQSWRHSANCWTAAPGGLPPLFPLPEN